MAGNNHCFQLNPSMTDSIENNGQYSASQQFPTQFRIHINLILSVSSIRQQFK